MSNIRVKGQYAENTQGPPVGVYKNGFPEGIFNSKDQASI